MMAPHARYILLLGVAMALLAKALPAHAQSTAHFDACTARTGSNATLIIPADAAVTAGPDAIAAGDEIAVFNAEGHCVGTAAWTGQNLALTVWGADSLQKDATGLRRGEAMRFRLWDRSENAEFADAAVSLSDEKPYVTANNRYVPDGIYVVEALRFDAEAQASR